MTLDSPTYQTLSAMITPALFMTANGSLIISTSNRMSRVVDRIRVLNELGDSLCRGASALDFVEERYEHLSDQLRHLEWRSDRVRYALSLLYLSFGSFVGTSLTLAVDVLFGNRLVAVPTLLAIAGVVLMMGASVNLVREAHRAILTNRLEVRFYRTLNERRKAAGGCGSGPAPRLAITRPEPNSKQKEPLMNGIDAIKMALDRTRFALNWYVSDLSDADLFVRPVPAANHIAWQFGNVIVGDKYLVREQLPDAVYPELPEGFMETHGPEGAAKDGPDGFLTKAGYLALFDEVRSATIATVDALTEADLDRPAMGGIADFAPTLGQLFLLVSNHTLLHAGQFSVIRRRLGKPVLF